MTTAGIKNILILTVLSLGILPAAAQDTLYLRNSERVVCTITKNRNNRIEYLPWNDNGNNYHSIDKTLIHYIKFSNGKCDTLNKIHRVAENSVDSLYRTNSSIAYEKGFQDGFNEYRPTAERVSGVLSVFVGIPGVIVPIAVSSTKVKARNIQNPAFVNSNSDVYRNAYLEGASKRRRQAVWSSYGITAGTAGVVAVAAIVIIVSYF